MGASTESMGLGENVKLYVLYGGRNGRMVSHSIEILDWRLQKACTDESSRKIQGKGEEKSARNEQNDKVWRRRVRMIKNDRNGDDDKK